jgi:4'-phosphopantetheinyl transferase
MQYLIFDNMTECSEQEIARLLPLVSDQRRKQALRYKHLFGQYCCLKSYEMLTELLASTPYTLHSTPSFLYNEHGAPSLSGGPYFSLSHSKRGIAVAISDEPIGIDIEAIRPLSEGLVQKAMNPQEQAQIAAAANPEQEFIRLWTRKEAYVKMQGTGIISDMHKILCDMLPVNWMEVIREDKGYICTIVEKNEQNQ